MAMSSILYVVLLAILPTLAISHSHHHHKHDLKSLHFTLYQHNIVNQTDFTISQGVGRANGSITTAPFGSITVLKVALTATPDPKSKVLGTVEGMAITSSFDGLDSLSLARFDLNLNDGHKGSLSTLGVINTLKPSDYPVVGGTRDFLFVQGYMTSSLLSIANLTFVYQQDFHLFWPSYAAHAM